MTYKSQDNKDFTQSPNNTDEKLTDEFVKNENPQQFGVNIDADAYNRLAVKTNGILLLAEDKNIQLKLSKDDKDSTASVLFQNNYSTRAEFGLVTSDDFELKISPDGSNFKQSFVIDHQNAFITFRQNILCEKKIEQKSHVSDASFIHHIDLDLGSIFEINILEAACNISFSNIDANNAFYFTVLINNPNLSPITWDNDILWPNGEAAFRYHYVNAFEFMRLKDKTYCMRIVENLREQKGWF